MDSAPFRKQFQYQSPAITAGLLPPHAATKSGLGAAFLGFFWPFLGPYFSID